MGKLVQYSVVVTLHFGQERETFEHDLLPALKRCGQHAARSIRCPGRREDFVQDVLAVGWKRAIILWSKLVEPCSWPCGFARQIVREVRGGRRIQGSNARSDVLNDTGTRQEGAPKVHSLAVIETQRRPVGPDRISRGVAADPAQLAALALDWDAWLASLSPRERRYVEECQIANLAVTTRGCRDQPAAGPRTLRRQLADAFASR